MYLADVDSPLDQPATPYMRHLGTLSKPKDAEEYQDRPGMV